MQDAHGLRQIGINTAFDLTTNHGMVGMGLGLDGGSWGQLTSEDKGTSDEDSNSSKGGPKNKNCTALNADGGRVRASSVTAQFDIQHQASVSDFLIFQRQKQDISVGAMTDVEIKQKILDLENEVLAYKIALAKRQEADAMFTSFYY